MRTASSLPGAATPRECVRSFLLALLLLVAWPPGYALAQTTPAQAKAALLRQFAIFTEWPEDTGIADPSRPFVLCVFGDHPIGSVLEEEVYSEMPIRGMQLLKRDLSDVSEIPGCHLLFIGRVDGGTLSDILSLTSESPILTVGDARGLAERGVLINLRFDPDSAFEINESAVHQSGLVIRLSLYRFATIVDPGGAER